MAKHIVGLIIFTLIVGVSVIVRGVTDYTTSVSVSKNYKLYKKKKKRKKRKKRRHCRPHKRSYSPNLSQVTFDRGTGLLSTRIENGSYGPRYGELQLHFYAHDRNGTNHLKTERLEFAPVGVEMSKEMPWLSRFDSEQNVYVIAEVKRGRRGWNYPPPFTISKATPLLISDR